jgi:hypothetical protein
MLIFKEQLPDCTDIEDIELPYDNVEEALDNILKISLQYDKPCIWFNKIDKPLKKFKVVVVGTGHDWGDALKLEEYIGTLLLWDDTLVLHYFLVDSDEFHKRMTE